MFWSALVASSLSIIQGVAQSYPNPYPVTGDTAVHDPTLTKDSSGTYWLFCSAVGIATRTSTDLVSWTYLGEMFPNGDAPWTNPYTGRSRAPLWAPDASYVNGTFYVYYAASTTGSQNSAIFLATSTTGEPGSWTNHGLVTSTSAMFSYNAIDPNLLVDGTVWYLSLGSFWTGIKGELVDPSSGKFYPSSNGIDSLAQRTANNGAIEASVIYKYGEYYYLFSSWDLCCQVPAINSTYNIRVGRSTSRSGPYADANDVALLNGGGTLVLATHDNIVAPGGQDLYNDTDRTILVYHYITPTGTYLGINMLNFSSGWPVLY